MSFVHQDPDFGRLLEIVSRATGIAAALVEKDYWVTHTLWALHETGLVVWFKGGTSLSKGFGIIQRFSEDLDLMIERGEADDVPEVTNWTSMNKGSVRRRQAFFDALEQALVVPGVRVERMAKQVDKRARGAKYLGYYPGLLLADLAPMVSPFVRLEVGSARVVPHVPRSLSSSVHDHLAELEMLGEYDDNRPCQVLCVHPLLTLFEKLEAMARRFEREPIEAESFVRHYEDAARIIRALGQLPSAGTTVQELGDDLVRTRDIRRLPSAEEPALALTDPKKRDVVERAHDMIAPMYWGSRLDLGEARAIIRAWLREQGWNSLS